MSRNTKIIIGIVAAVVIVIVVIVVAPAIFQAWIDSMPRSMPV